jgi:hypothetical protein
MKFTLYSNDDEVITEQNFETVALDQLLINIDRFIRASGFLPKGQLEYVEEEEE